MEGPYRAPKPLTEVIAPDRRRQRAVLLVVASMVAGAALFQLARTVLEGRDDANVLQVTQLPTTTSNKIAPTTLRGPNGTLVIPAATQRTVVNVWLQGCADCMPAFEAMQVLARTGGLRVHTVNVAYGEADPVWAARYGVSQNLVYDTGGAALVRPLGITTFTTLVVDVDGTILHRDRPDRPGYAERIRNLVGESAAPEPPPTPTPLFAPGSLSADEVQRVVATHRAEVKRACWERSDSKDRPDSAKVTLSIVVGAMGDVVSSSASGTNALVASCVEAQARTWHFLAHGERSPPVQIPFFFARE